MADPSGRVLLLTNDDGANAPGIVALKEAAAEFGRCKTIAPDGPMSGCGHQVTTHRPILIVPRSDDHFVVTGTPADCVRLGLRALATETTWVFSGINPGGNLGTDVYISGTVAAVREAAIRGVPGIAISHYIARGGAIDWTQATRWASLVLRQLMGTPPEPGTYWNVNLPHLPSPSNDPEIVICPLDLSPLPADYHIQGNEARYCGDYQSRARQPDADVAVCFGGRISATLIRLP